MKLLGWSGGGLGRDAAGIEEPISVQLNVNRKGLGLQDSSSNDNLNKKYFHNYLKTYRDDEKNIHELVFSKDFTKEERASLHA